MFLSQTGKRTKRNLWVPPWLQSYGRNEGNIAKFFIWIASFLGSRDISYFKFFFRFRRLPHDFSPITNANLPSTDQI